MNLTNSLFQSKKFVRTWQVVLALFCLFALTSKSGFQLFLELLILLAVFGLNWRNFIKQEKLGFAILLLYPLAIICGIFSVGHITSAIHTALAWPWPLVVLPTLLIIRRPEDIKIVKYGLAASLILACDKSIYNFGEDFFWCFGSHARVASFWDLSRWGLFCGLSFLFLLSAFQAALKNHSFNRKLQLSLLIFLLGDLICLCLANTRGPWLALAVSLLIFLFLYPRVWKTIASLLVVAVLIFASTKTLRNRFLSIFTVQTQQGQLVSQDRSNQGRLSMWKVALDFFQEQPVFGTGLENTEDSLRNFLQRQSEEYRQKYTTVEYSYRDQHSSWLSMLVQMGGLFFLTFTAIVVAAICQNFCRWWRTRSLWDATLLAAIVFHLVLSVFYTSFLSFEVVSFIPLLVAGRMNNERA